MKEKRWGGWIRTTLSELFVQRIYHECYPMFDCEYKIYFILTKENSKNVMKK